MPQLRDEQFYDVWGLGNLMQEIERADEAIKEAQLKYAEMLDQKIVMEAALNPEYEGMVIEVYERVYQITRDKDHLCLREMTTLERPPKPVEAH